MIFDDDTLEMLGASTQWESLAIHAETLYQEKLARNRILRERDADTSKRTARIHAKIVCISCGKETIANRPSRKKNCSDRCRLRATMARWHARGLTSRGTPKIERKAKTEEEKQALIRRQRIKAKEKYHSDPVFRAKRIAATIRSQQKRKAA